MEKVLISICIPAYKRISYLQRLLDSIAIQTFTDFEVIVTDDSPDSEVKQLCGSYNDIFLISYYRNEKSLGTPGNWNEAICRAQGQWIKLMHDDDWFSDSESLQVLADAIHDRDGEFIFSAYHNVYLPGGRKEKMMITPFRMNALKKNTASLFSKNVIGPPSVILHRNDHRFVYDRNTKWVVDIDFYIQRLKTEKIKFISRPLINVGISDQQVTVECFGVRQVQIPEHFYLLKKVGYHCLNNMLVYDAWWRLFRNLEIRYESEIREAGYSGVIHSVLRSMIHWQKNIPRQLLTTGVFSKICMCVHYLLYRNQLRP